MEPDACAPQVRQRVLADQECTGEIHVERIPPVVFRERIDRGLRGHRRRSRNYDVESPERIDSGGDPGAHRSGIADVAPRGVRSPPRTVELGRDRGGRAFVDIEALHRRAFGRECPRDRRTDPPARSRDHRNLVFQPSHGVLLDRILAFDGFACRQIDSLRNRNPILDSEAAPDEPMTNL